MHYANTGDLIQMLIIPKGSWSEVRSQLSFPGKNRFL